MVPGVSGAGSTSECHRRFPATPTEQGPCSLKAAPVWRTVVQKARLAKGLPRLRGQEGTGTWGPHQDGKARGQAEEWLPRR